jgi:hypothetical protein
MRPTAYPGILSRVVSKVGRRGNGHALASRSDNEETLEIRGNLLNDPDRLGGMYM